MEVKPPAPFPSFSPPPVAEEGGRSASEQRRVANALAFPADYCELWTVVLEVKPPAPSPSFSPPPVADKGGRSANEQRRMANALAFPADYCELRTVVLEMKPSAPVVSFFRRPCFFTRTRQGWLNVVQSGIGFQGHCPWARIPPPPVAEEGGRSANEQRRMANALAFPADYCELWTMVLEVKPPAPFPSFSPPPVAEEGGRSANKQRRASIPPIGLQV